MKLIALDVGTKRIGVAKADSAVRIAIPYEAVEVNNGEEFKKLASLSRAWDIQNFVIGLPRNSQGEETKQSAYVREFATQLKKTIPGAKICFQDESLTSVEAEKRLKNRKKGVKKGDIDSEAAAIILQDFLEEKVGKTTSRAAAARRRSVRGKKPHHRLVVALVGVAVLLVAASVVAWSIYSANLRPVVALDCESIDADECDATVFNVESGANINDVASGLEEAGLIRNAFAFQLYFRLNSGGGTIKAGAYDFTPAMTVKQIAGLLIHGSNSVYRFTTYPGSTVRDIRKDLIGIGYNNVAVDVALSASRQRPAYADLFTGMPEDATSLEGYLFGNTYEFYRDDPAETVVRRLLDEMQTVVKDNDLANLYAALGLNLYQGITLASVVQREANTPEDMAKVAQIFFNRLNSNMPLGSDVTAIYAVDLIDPDRKEYTTPAAVIAVDSLYNTRKYAGIPYGPVSNPGLDALLAVAHPDPSAAGYLYFLTGDDGAMHYAATETEHQTNITTYCQKLCNINL